MSIPVTQLFRILVIGEEYANVCRTIEEKLRFNVTLVPSGGYAEAIRAGADLGAIVVSRADAAGAIAQRDARGLRMPVFLLSRRDEETFSDPNLKALDAVVIAELETRDFYAKRLRAAVEKYALTLMTPF